MPVVGGNTNELKIGSVYRRNSLRPLAQQFLETARSVQQETSYDIFEEPVKILNRPGTLAAFKKAFCENFIDESGSDPIFDDIEIADRKAMMEQQFDNNVDALRENAALAVYNPVIGMAFPVHKNILMNMVFDKGAIQKVVSTTPKFTISMEKRFLVDTDGNEIDMFLDQNAMTRAIDNSNPKHLIDISLPENGATDVLSMCGGTKLDSLSIKTHVAYVMVDTIYVAEGEYLPDANNIIDPRTSKKAESSEVGAKNNVWLPTRIEFKPSYNPYERSFVQPIKLRIRTAASTIEDIKDTLTGVMDRNKFTIYGATNKIKKIKLSAELDTTNAMQDTCKVKWTVEPTLVEIPDAVKFNTTISPEELKDIAALYQVDQLTKVMSLFKTAMANYKDDKILEFLNDSYARLDPRSKGYGEYDYAPPTGYALDDVEYRHKTFFDKFDSMMTPMYQVLNDPNMIVTAFGDPDIVRRLTPTEYTYTTPSSIGPVELDHKRTVVTSDKRIYQFIGSDKLRGSKELIVILNPRNSDRVIYRIYDYQFYVSNEIRDISNPALPNINAFERWLIQEYQPVQTRIKLLNISGRRP